jgi:hypothetical protein
LKIQTIFVVTAILGALTLGGCAKKNDTPEAVKEGILRDIAKNFDVASMDVNVDSVSFRDNEADAVVSYSLKGSKDPSSMMTMKYLMERHSDGKWYIKSRYSNAGGSDNNAVPAGHPETSGAAGADGNSIGGALGVGTGDSGGSTLPPGHPDISKGQSQSQ